MHLGFPKKKMYEFVEGNANYHSDLEAKFSFSDLERASKKGVFSLKVQNMPDGGKQVEMRGTREFMPIINHRLHISPSGRVFLDALFYRSTMKADRIRGLLLALESEVSTQIGSEHAINTEQAATGVDVARVLAKPIDF